ncbi:transporter [Halobacteriales archaeon QS_8_69_26]|nr:MAG: transporter [Halobacteriales archaeon QS_8_69_26]
MDLAERYARTISGRPVTVVVVLLLATAAVGSAAGSVDSDLTIAEFASDSEEAEKLDYVESNFSTEGENTTAMQVVIRDEDGNVLTRESLIESLRLQRSIREDPGINATLVDGQPTVGLANLVAIEAMRAEGGGPPGADDGGGPPSSGDGDGDGPPGATTPSLDRQIRQLESMSDEKVRAVLARLLDPDRTAGGPDPYVFLPTDHEPGSTTAEARMVFVFQTAPAGDELPAAVAEAQLATDDLAEDRYGDRAFVFGQGIVEEESSRATGESFRLITPVALLLVLGVLLIAYRDPVDVALGLLGIVLVLVWMGGAMGWLGIGVTQILIAVPFLLIGLSIDFALHMVMRYREAREADPDRSVTEGMRVGLAGVTVALAAATFTTAVGFFSNGVSPIEPIRQFGIVSGIGIVSAFVVFAGLIPALKVLVDRLLERVGFDRRKRAFGTGSGPVNRLLSVGAVLARRAPVALVVVALVVSAGGGYAATDIDTSLNQEDFLPRDSPAWMDSVPDPFRPGDFDLKENALYVNDKFAQDRDQARAEILIEGSVTDDDTLERVADARDRTAETDTALTLASGEPRVEGPVSLVRSVAARNETVAAVVDRADTDGNGIPDRNLRAVYDAVFDAAPEEAGAVIHRECTGGGEDRDCEYLALRMGVTVEGGANARAVTDDTRGVAAGIEEGSDLTATATGQPVITAIVQQGLLRTLVETFLITLGVILAFLSLVFYRRYDTPWLGAVTMVPVVFALSWILGTMYLLGIPFNTETAVIASIAIGLGVDYAIHVSERFVEERERRDSTADAMEATLSGTGGALLASAATTASGFGVLTLALVPSLRRFGIVTGTTIAYAFVACVVVLPSLLTLWARYRSVPGADQTAAGTVADPESEPGSDHGAEPGP